METKYIGIYNNSLDGEYCNYLINIFENHKDKFPGHTLGGIDKNIKDTDDLLINTSCSDKTLLEIEEKLSNELINKLNVYLKMLNNTFPENNPYNFFLNKIISNNHGFQLQRYIKGVGKFTYHNDFTIDWGSKTHRIITFMWYLNDIEEGGETEFFGNYKIKPEKGKLVFFPATWTFPHRGCVPISSNKYILTGWLYEGIDGNNIKNNMSDIKKTDNMIEFNIQRNILDGKINNNDNKKDDDNEIDAS